MVTNKVTLFEWMQPPPPIGHLCPPSSHLFPKCPFVLLALLKVSLKESPIRNENFWQNKAKPQHCVVWVFFLQTLCFVWSELAQMPHQILRGIVVTLSVVCG